MPNWLDRVTGGEATPLDTDTKAKKPAARTGEPANLREAALQAAAARPRTSTCSGRRMVWKRSQFRKSSAFPIRGASP